LLNENGPVIVPVQEVDLVGSIFGTVPTHDPPTQSYTWILDSPRLPSLLFVTVPLTPTLTTTLLLLTSNVAPGLQLLEIEMPVLKDKAVQCAVLDCAVAVPPPTPPIDAVMMLSPPFWPVMVAL
jgi:hypothetical protein